MSAYTVFLRTKPAWRGSYTLTWQCIHPVLAQAYNEHSHLALPIKSKTLWGYRQPGVCSNERQRFKAKLGKTNALQHLKQWREDTKQWMCLKSWLEYCKDQLLWSEMLISSTKGQNWNGRGVFCTTSEGVLEEVIVHWMNTLVDATSTVPDPQGSWCQRHREFPSHGGKSRHWDSSRNVLLLIWLYMDPIKTWKSWQGPGWDLPTVWVPFPPSQQGRLFSSLSPHQCSCQLPAARTGLSHSLIPGPPASTGAAVNPEQMDAL